MNDMVDRQEAIDAIGKHKTLYEADHGWDKSTLDALDTAIKALRQPQRTGKWIFPYGDRKYKKCSACERVYYSIPHNSNYCPNCGAKMEGR